jgi:YVTN family beta-propeller protein
MRALLLLLVAFACATLACQRDDVRVLVSNEDSGDVSVIDAHTDRVIATIPVGNVALSGSPKAPPGAREEEHGPRDDAADGIGVVDLRRGELVRVLASGRDPESFDLTPDGATLYVSNEETSEVSVIDVASARDASPRSARSAA